MSIMTEIQGELKAPKGQENQFGGYKYRSCEDIVEAVKPLLNKHKAHLRISDEMVQLGDRYYVKATASVRVDDKTIEEVCGWARECLDRKGMDESQITGATSSYARKYALNGLFAIDDTKDADTMDNTQPVYRFKKGEKDELMKQVRDCLFNGDGERLNEIWDGYADEDPSVKGKLWALFDSTERSSMKELMKNDR